MSGSRSLHLKSYSPPHTHACTPHAHPTHPVAKIPLYGQFPAERATVNKVSHQTNVSLPGLLLTQFPKEHPHSSSILPSTLAHDEEDTLLPKQGSEAPYSADMETPIEITQLHAPAHFTEEHTEARTHAGGGAGPRSFLLSLYISKRRALLSRWGSCSPSCHTVPGCNLATPSFLTACSSALPAEEGRISCPNFQSAFCRLSTASKLGQQQRPVAQVGVPACLPASILLCQTVSSRGQELGLSSHDLGQVPYTLKGFISPFSP